MKPIVKKVLIGVGVIGGLFLLATAKKAPNLNTTMFKFPDGQVTTPIARDYNLMVSGQTVSIAGRTDVVGTLTASGIQWSNDSFWSFA